MMTNNEIEKVRKAAAKTDLGRARRKGSLLITETAEGLVELEYSIICKKYTLTRCGTYKQAAALLAFGTASEVAPVLEKLYIIVEGEL